jgi:hypothetical protein
MSTTITLDKRHFKAASDKARALGTTPETFVESLIDAATLTFDEVLAPVRKSFAKSAVTESELDVVVSQARKNIHRRSRGKSRK